MNAANVVKNILSAALEFYKKNSKLVWILLAVLVIGSYIGTRHTVKRAIWGPSGNSMEGFAGGEPSLYFVYATWCPHCKGVLPKMQDAQAAGPLNIGGKKVGVEIIESEEKDRIKGLGVPVEGYPSFFYGTPGALQEYPGGERTLEAIKSWISTLGA
jgi:thiol-disulfide isomerase/thioredoxin